MADSEQPRRLSLLYQLYLASTESRRFMRLALRDTDMSGEEYGIYSYFYANGPRTQAQASVDLGYAVTTLASLLAPILQSGDLVRRPHPTDGRARLLELSPDGRLRLESAIPAFTDAYQALLAELRSTGVDPESVFTALGQLRDGIADTSRRLEMEG